MLAPVTKIERALVRRSTPLIRFANVPASWAVVRTMMMDIIGRRGARGAGDFDAVMLDGHEVV